MHPVHAWDQAADQAFAQAGEALMGSDIRSGLRSTHREGDNAGFGVAMHRTQGTLWGVGIAGWWLDRDGKGPTGGCRRPPCSKPGTVWAVACVRGHEARAAKALPGAFRGPLPDWMRRPGLGSGDRMCALGVSGPTLKPDKAVELAYANARHRLAQLMCAYLDNVTVDWVNDRSWQFPEVSTSAEAARIIDEDAEDGPSWRDRQGVGPLGVRGATYARVCVTATRIRCDRSRDRHAAPDAPEPADSVPDAVQQGTPGDEAGDETEIFY